ncbi:MAG TPA: Bax inhibitor-1/YccA family protein [candidate division Zixibacteria bacterium]|nr:Bax inhibitor-1/YccA family protein [candidate division Zixibacteria bacterium]
MNFSYGSQSGLAAPAPRALAVDRSFLNTVYLWMTGGLLLSGFTALLVSVSPGLLNPLLESQGLLLALVLAQLGAVVFLVARLEKMSVQTARLTFLAYSVLTGFTLSTVFLVYTQATLFMTFVVSAGTFGLTSTWAIATKRDLSRLGSILFMGLIGLVLATVVNMFWANSTLYWITTYAGVLLFVGLTAYDTQYLKRLGQSEAADGERGQKLAIFGALKLYLDFINLFLLLLRIMGDRR